MATTAKIAKEVKKQSEIDRARAKGGQAKFAVRLRNRCKNCGRRHAYMRRFQVCRICFRELALQGKLPGVTKASW